MITINDLNNEAVSIYNNRSEKYLKTIYEPAPGLFIAESAKVIERALDAGYEPVSLLIENGESVSENVRIIERIESMGVPVYCADSTVFAGITGVNLTRGALCAFKRERDKDFTEIIQGKSRIAVLEEVVNPTNLGAIFRSAAALGMEAVILTEGSADPLYRRTSRVSMGTMFQIPFAYMEKDKALNITKTLNEYGFKTVSFALRNNSVDIDDPKLKKEPALAIIMGTEGDGLKSETINESDYVVKIPMYNGVDSLNVAAAAAVAFWELGRR